MKDGRVERSTNSIIKDTTTRTEARTEGRKKGRKEGSRE